MRFGRHTPSAASQPVERPNSRMVKEPLGPTVQQAGILLGLGRLMVSRRSSAARPTVSWTDSRLVKQPTGRTANRLGCVFGKTGHPVRLAQRLLLPCAAQSITGKTTTGTTTVRHWPPRTKVRSDAEYTLQIAFL